MTVIGRETEYKRLENEMKKFIDTGISTSIYISGVPGSGKTYTLLTVLKDLKYPYSYINAGNLKTKSQIYKHIYDFLPCSKCKMKSSLTTLYYHFTNCNYEHILVIDEMDLLFSRSQNILYNLIDLAYLENSKILLILISNTMNLPEKSFELKVCSRVGKNRINFKPYTHVQLKNILKVNNLDVEIITRKIGGICGDIRKVINQLKTEKKHIPSVLDISYYQKLVLYVLLESKHQRIQDVYKDMKVFCNMKGIDKLNFFEFMDILKDLEKFDLIHLSNKIVLNVFKEDIERNMKSDKEYESFKNII